jgi:hypothetical protein
MASYPIYPISASCPLPTRGWSYTFAAPEMIEAGGTTNADPPYSNTKEILIYNGSSADPVYVGFILVAAPAVFPPAAPDLVTFLGSSTIIPPGTGLTLSIGPEGYRAPLNSRAQWAAASLVYGPYVGGAVNEFVGQRVGSGYNFVVYAPTVTTAFDVNVTYVQGPGGGGGQTP